MKQISLSSYPIIFISQKQRCSYWAVLCLHTTQSFGDLRHLLLNPRFPIYNFFIHVLFKRENPKRPFVKCTAKRTTYCTTQMLLNFTCNISNELSRSNFELVTTEESEVTLVSLSSCFTGISTCISLLTQIKLNLG